MKKHKHNTIKVVLVTLLLFMLLSWILPAAYFSTVYVDQGRVQMGLFDLIIHLRHYLILDILHYS